MILIFLGFPCIYSKAERNRISNRKNREPLRFVAFSVRPLSFNPTPSIFYPHLQVVLLIFNF
jgi:hypothetical protein